MALDPKLSPHCLQNPNSTYISDPFDENLRLLKDDSPRETYTPHRHNQDQSVVHYGRRQLLLNEIEFLTIAINSYKV